MVQPNPPDEYTAVLRFRELHGCAIGAAGKSLLAEKRACTQAVLLVFARHAGTGTPVPNNVIHTITIQAGLEIEESMGFHPTVR